MPATLQLFQFPVTAQNVRVQGDLNYPWFHLADICAILGLTNPTMIIDRIDSEDKAKFNLGLPGQNPWFVNESGLYDVVLRSDKPIAKTFRRWVTSEVLPSIRKTGSYTAKTQDQQHFQPFGIKINLAEKMENLIEAIDSNISDPVAVSHYTNALNALQRIAERTKEVETKHIADTTLLEHKQALIINYLAKRQGKPTTLNQIKGGIYHFKSNKTPSSEVQKIITTMLGSKVEFVPNQGYKLI